MQGLIYSYDFLLNPFPSLVSLLQICSRHLMSLQVWRQCLHTIFWVWWWPAVGIIKYFEVVLLICHLETIPRTDWTFFDAWTHCSWDFKSHVMMSPRTYAHYFTLSWVELQESFIQPISKCIQILLEWYCTICIHYCCPDLGTNIKKRHAPYWPSENSTGDLYAFWATSCNINLYISVRKKNTTSLFKRFQFSTAMAVHWLWQILLGINRPVCRKTGVRYNGNSSKCNNHYIELLQLSFFHLSWSQPVERC